MKRNPFVLSEFQKKVKALTNDEDISLIKEESRELSSIKDKLNVFEMIGMGRREIKHSYFLRWLCGNYQHGFRHNLFNLFLDEIYKNDADLKKYTKNRSKILEIPLKEKTFKECYKKGKGYGKGQLDFFAIDKINERLFVIEVKIDHHEGEDQLQRYYKYCTEEYKDYEKKFIFLTEDGRKPEKDKDQKNWDSVSYHRLASTLNKFTENISDENFTFKLAIEHYKEFLNKPKRMKEIDKKLKDLCENVWFKHRDILGTLIKYRPEIHMNAGGLLKLLEDNDYEDVKLFVPLNNEPYEVTLKSDVKLHFKQKTYENTNDLYNYALKNEERKRQGKPVLSEDECRNKSSGPSNTKRSKERVTCLNDKDDNIVHDKYYTEQKDYKILSERIKKLKKKLKKENNKLFDRLEIFISS